jgi:hypothetical protein
MAYSEKMRVKGVFALKIFNASDELLEDYVEENLVVNGGLSALAHLLGSYTSGKEIDRVQFGTNGSTPLVSDDEITDPVEKALEATTYPATNSVAFDFALGLEEGNGTTIREFGLLCADDTVFARKVRAAIDKTDQIRLVGTWTITFN